MIWAALNAMPTFFGALLLAGIVSAGLSSASTFLTLVGFAISNDVMHESSATDAARLRVSRITIFVVGGITLILATVVPPDVFWITNFVGPMFAAVWGPVALMSVWSKRISEPAAFWGMVNGFVSYVAFRSIALLDIAELPAYFDPLLLGFVCSLLTVTLVSRITHVTAAETAYREALFVEPPELADPAACRRTMIWPAILVAWGVVSAILLLVVYTHPYQLAVGLIDENGPYLVWSGELFIALFFGIAPAFAGVVAYGMLRRQSVAAIT
jgi:sodium/pantothenate symporter